MDAIRAYEKYLSARIRVGHMNCSLAGPRYPFRKDSNSRLPKVERFASVAQMASNARLKSGGPGIVAHNQEKACHVSKLTSKHKKSKSGCACQAKTAGCISNTSCKGSGSAGTCSRPKTCCCETCNGPSNPDCDREIYSELCCLRKQLDAMRKRDCKQKEQIALMDEQMDVLSCSVKTLTSKCRTLETENKKLCKEKRTCNCCIRQSPSKTHSANNQDTCAMDPQCSSHCQFCKKKNLPLLCSMQYTLFKMMGKRCFKDIALTILLRADNVYHVNVKDLESCKVLGCMLVTDGAIKEANALGIFQDVLTFCVVDLRNTLNCKNAINGGVNFEIVHDKRLTGGVSSRILKSVDRKWSLHQLKSVVNITISQTSLPSVEVCDCSVDFISDQLGTELNDEICTGQDEEYNFRSLTSSNDSKDRRATQVKTSDELRATELCSHGEPSGSNNPQATNTVASTDKLTNEIVNRSQSSSDNQSNPSEVSTKSDDHDEKLSMNMRIYSECLLKESQNRSFRVLSKTVNTTSGSHSASTQNGQDGSLGNSLTHSKLDDYSSSLSLSSISDELQRQQPKLTKTKANLFKALREISKYDSEMVLADTETKYPVRTIRVTNLTPSCSDFNDDKDDNHPSLVI